MLIIFIIVIIIITIIVIIIVIIIINIIRTVIVRGLIDCCRWLGTFVHGANAPHEVSL